MSLQDHIRADFCYFIAPSNMVGIRLFCTRAEYEIPQTDEEGLSEECRDNWHLSITNWNDIHYLVIGFHRAYLAWYQSIADECELNCLRGRPMSIEGEDRQAFPLDHSIDMMFTLSVKGAGNEMEELLKWDEESEKLELYRPPEEERVEGEEEEADGLPEIVFTEE
jgi:hypothetical protein